MCFFMHDLILISNYFTATFAAGCFWGLELAMQRIPGVVYSAVGYTQGKLVIEDT